MTAPPVNGKYDAELTEIRTRILEMKGEVELMVCNSIKSLAHRDSPLAQSVIACVPEIQVLGEELEHRCLHLLGHCAPAAPDRRFVTRALKVVVDLERICHQCGGIARKVLELNREALLAFCVDLTPMAEAVNASVREAVDAFLHADGALALKVFQGARMVDGLNDQAQRVMLTVMMEDPATIWRALRINAISKHLETIADSARNIAETAALMAGGKDAGQAAA